MPIKLNDEIRRLLDGRHFAVLATINPDGSGAAARSRTVDAESVRRCKAGMLER